MKFIKVLFPVIVLSITSIDLSAQTTIKYIYDEAGNRTDKHLYIGGVKKSGKISDESPLDNEEEKVEEMLSETKISIYPNPTQGSLVVQFENLPKDKQSTISVFDINGELIINNSQLTNRNFIDLTNHSPGTYLLIISIGNNFTQWKVIKQ